MCESMIVLSNFITLGIKYALTFYGELPVGFRLIDQTSKKRGREGWRETLVRRLRAKIWVNRSLF